MPRYGEKLTQKDIGKNTESGIKPTLRRAEQTQLDGLKLIQKRNAQYG
jgi:hypothetical protein